MKLIGRIREIQKLDKLVASSQSEFLAVYGRRRVGKTFLIRSYFKNEFDFYATGLAKGNTKQQLTNFTIFLNNYFSNHYEVPSNWLEAFNLLIKELEKNKSAKKRVIFIDEMPWMDEVVQFRRTVYFAGLLIHFACKFAQIFQDSCNPKRNVFECDYNRLLCSQKAQFWHLQHYQTDLFLTIPV